jgi:hypothetical protein
MLSVVKPNVTMLSVVVPFEALQKGSLRVLYWVEKASLEQTH